MKMADVMLGTMLHVGLVIVLPGVWLLAGALWPSVSGRAQQRILKMPIGTFFIGLPIGLAVFFASVFLGNANLPWLAVPLAILGVGWALFGLSAFSRHVGERLLTPGEPPWRTHLRGSVVLTLSFFLPFIGWFLILPVALALGLGSATLSLFQPLQIEAPEDAPTAVSSKKKNKKKKVEVPA